MAKAKLSQAKQYAYEEFMRRAEKEKRVRREEISMKALKPDTTLQARVDNINTEHVRSLHELLKNGQELAPIVVFEIAPGKLKIADGFHRHEVYRREGRPAIPCLVVTGTLQEAVEYAASCNQVLSLPRKREDIKKAIYMLLENGWLERSAKQVARHIGCSPTAANKYLAAYCSENAIEAPCVIVYENGAVRRKPRHSSDPAILGAHRRAGRRTYYYTNINGRQFNLGHDKEEAERKLDAINREKAGVLPKLVALKSTLRFAIASRGVFLSPVSDSDDRVLHRISGYRTKTTAVSVWEDHQLFGLKEAIAEVHLIAAHFKLPRKVVIKQSDDHAFQSLIEVATSGLGVEFMTLDEFVASEKDAAQ